MAVRKFEDALARLEVIVAELERGELSMDASLKIFEEGVRLSKQCMKGLEDAGKQVEILLQDSDGTLCSQPFPLEAGQPTQDTIVSENASTILDEDY